MEKFRNNLVQVINNAKLPIGEAYYVLKDVFKDVQDENKKAVDEKEKEEQMAAMQAALDKKEAEELITEDDLK